MGINASTCSPRKDAARKRGVILPGSPPGGYLLPPPRYRKNDETAKKKLLVLDLDETLIHSDFGVPKGRCDFTFDLDIQGARFAVFVAMRPGPDPPPTPFSSRKKHP